MRLYAATSRRSATRPPRAENGEYLDAEPHVIVEQLLSGRSRETGLSLDARHWSVFPLRNGKVVRWRFYGTRDEALEAARLEQ